MLRIRPLHRSSFLLLWHLANLLAAGASITIMLALEELDPAYDAVVAAPEFHTVLLDSSRVRVLEVVVPPGTREPFHTHVCQSVFVAMRSPSLLYYVPAQPDPLTTIPSRSETAVLHLAPEGLHALENRETYPLYAFRVELKDAPEPASSIQIHGPILETGSPGDNLSLETATFRVCLGNQLHSVEPGLPVIWIADPSGTPQVSWLESGNARQQVEKADILIALKY